MYRIMIVDDEENILSSLNRILKKEDDFQIVAHTDPHAALADANRSQFHLFLSDYRMPSMNGVDFLVRTKNSNPHAMRIIISGVADFTALMDAINQAEIYRFIPKPIQVHELLQTLRQALHTHTVMDENRRLSALVKEQKNELKNREYALKHFAELHPTLANVEWENDGSIILGEGDLDP
jgi:two-component system, probable response regulator PhcQ